MWRYLTVISSLRDLFDVEIYEIRLIGGKYSIY
jgi:hypothetical protein